MNSLPLLTVIIPLLSAPVAFLFKDKESTSFTAIVCIITCIPIAFMVPAVSNGTILKIAISSGLNMELSFMADSISILVGFASITIWTLASIYSIGYMSHETNLRRYNFFSLLSLCGMMGVVFTRNLFSLYIFFEMLSICSYVMVIHVQTFDAMRAGLKYLFMGVAGGLVLLMAMIVTVAITGTGDLIEISRQGIGLLGHPWVPFIMGAYLLGFGVKAGIFPVHVWLPDAHPVAPAPASALLSGVMIKAGAYGIFRTVYTIMGLDTISHSSMMSLLLTIAIINILLGSAMAIRQTEIKRLMAYSSIAQMGYIMLGVALMTPRGVTGGVLHIFNHAFIKGSLFCCAGAFIHQTKLRNIEDLKGIGRAMPFTTICFTLAGLSMIGFPPFNGFISKWFLGLGSIDAARMGLWAPSVGIGALIVLLFSSFLNLIYYGPIIYYAWFPPDDKELAVDKLSEGNHDPGRVMKIPLMLMAGGTLFFGIFPQWPLSFARHFSSLIF